MTQPAPTPTPTAMPAAAPPVEAIQATPAPTETSNAGVTQQHAQKRLQAFVTKKVYGTKPATKSPMPVTTVSEAAPAASEVAEGQPAEAEGGTPAAQEAKPTEGATESKPADAATTPDKPVETLSEAEFSKRMARLNRQAEKVAQERQAFAREREQAQVVAQRLQIIERAAAAAKQNPIAFLQQLGVGSQAVLDAIIADGAKPEATKLEEARAKEAEAFNRRVAELEKQMKDAQEAQARDKWTADAAAYVTATVAPLFADTAKYELTLRALGSPEAAANEVFDLQRKRYALTLAEVREGKRQHPEALTPEQAADRIEALLRSQLNKLTGTSAKPAETPKTTNRVEPANANPNGSPTHKTATPVGRYSTPRKPYSTRDKGAA